MKFLLDTHVWIWSLMSPEKLSQKTKKTLLRQDSELWLSPISVWEFLTLVKKDRIRLHTSPQDWLREAKERFSTHEAPLTHDIVMAGETCHLPHPDPADRFLVATANHLGLTLVTADKRLITARACTILAAT